MTPVLVPPVIITLIVLVVIAPTLAVMVTSILMLSVVVPLIVLTLIVAPIVALVLAVLIGDRAAEGLRLRNHRADGAQKNHEWERSNEAPAHGQVLLKSGDLPANRLRALDPSSATLHD